MKKEIVFMQDKGYKKKKPEIWITSDEHYGHSNIIKYNNRPFENVDHMNEILINNHNDVVQPQDIVIHAGDFTLKDKTYAQKIIKQLSGTHIFLKGSHDRWLPKNAPMIYEKTMNGRFFVVCHYCLRTWGRSHYNSYHFYGHSHGKLPPIGKSWDIGVDNNEYFPFNLNDLYKLMEKRPNNPNFITKNKKHDILEETL